MEGIVRVPKELPGVNPSDGESGRSVGAQDHMGHLRQTGWAEQGRDRIDVGRLPLQQTEPSRRIHPPVGQYDEDARGDAADGDGQAGGQMRGRAQQAPAVEIEAEKDRFREERRAFE